MRLIPFASRLNPRLCLPCLLPAAVFLAASLTPSLVLRPMLLQAVLSGLSFAVGYGLGAGWITLRRYLGLPALSGRMARTAGIIAAVICVSLVVVSLWHMVHWQNSLREIMGMEKVLGLQPFLLVPVAVATFLLFLVLARVFRWLWVRASRGLARHILITVCYEGHWSWIEKSDFRSKRTLAYMLVLQALADTGAKEGLPAITIQAN